MVWMATRGDPRRPTAVGVDAQLDLGADRRAHRPHARHILIRLDPDLNLHGPKALLDRPGGDLGRALRRDARDRELGGDELAHRPAEQPVDRQAGGLAQNIPQRHLDRRLGERVACQRALDHDRQPLDRSRVLADQLRRQQRLDEVRRGHLVLAAPDRRGGDLADPDDPGVGVELDQQEQRDRVRAAPALDGALRVDRDTDRDRFDLRNLHWRCQSCFTFSRFAQNCTRYW
jgi:hypothetical protein